MGNISKVLESGSSEEKIHVLEGLDDTVNPRDLEEIVLRLDDEDIRVRGEAFCLLVSNKNEISEILIDSLSAASKNIRGFGSLVLANRDETVAIPNITRLAKDKDSMVRSCALGALGHLKATEAKDVFLEALSDSDIETRKSALWAVVDLEIRVSKEMINKILTEGDSEIKEMISVLREKS